MTPDDVRFALLVACCTLAVPSALSVVYHHLTIVGASGLTGSHEGEWHGSWSDAAGNPEMKPFVRRELISIAVFATAAIGAWVLHYEPALALRILQVLF